MFGRGRAGSNRKGPARKVEAPREVIVLAHGKRRADQSYALAIAVGAGLAVVGLGALAAWLHYVRDVDLTWIGRNLIAPGGIGVGLLSLAGWMLREKLSPQMGGMQRELAAMKAEVAQRDAAHAAELAAMERRLVAERAAFTQALEQVTAEVSGAAHAMGRMAGEFEALGAAVMGDRQGVQAATSAAVEAADAVMAVQEALLGAARASAQQRADAEAAAQRAAALEEEAAEEAARLQLEEAQLIEVRAAGERLRLANERADREREQRRAAERAELDAALEAEAEQAAEDEREALAAGASWLDSGKLTVAPVTPAEPLQALPPMPEPVKAAAPPRVITPLDPEWQVPPTGALPVVPPKTDPDQDTAVHHWIHTGHWPEGYDPNNPPPRNKPRQ